MNAHEFAAAWTKCLTGDARCALVAAEWLGGCQSMDQWPALPEVFALKAPFGPVAEGMYECAHLARDPQWTSGTAETSSLPALHQRLLSEHFPHLPVAFLRDLIAMFLGKQRAARRTQFAFFPLVPERSAVGSPVLARFVLELLVEGNGQVFLDPRQAFLELYAAFADVFAHAAAVAKPLCPKNAEFRDVRVGIAYAHLGKPIDKPLTGNSGGGALALGLAALWSGRPLEAGIVTSFALTAKDATTPDGKCHRIGGATEKAWEIAKSKPGKGIFLVSDQQPDLKELKEAAEQTQLLVKEAKDLTGAFETATGRLAGLLAYLDALAEAVNKAPPYYPPGARMDRVRVRVRVSSERIVFNPKAVASREQERRRSGGDDEEERPAYNHRHSGVGEGREGKEERAEVRILDWDREVRGKLRRGVVVGDPGIGKTWLARWEAAQLAREAADKLRATGDPTGVTLPVYRRLADVAEALVTLKGRRRSGQPELPLLDEAVIESLRTMPIPAADGGKAHGPSDAVLNLLRERLGTEHGVLLLDAFDEVPAERRADLLAALKAWVGANRNARVLFTSRVVGYERPWDLAASEQEREMELLPLDDGQMKEFVEKLFDADRPAGEELLGLLRRAPQLRGLAQIPLLLGFLCAMHSSERRKPAGERWDLARLRRSELFEAVLEHLLSGAWRDQQTKPSDSALLDKRELVQHVAYTLLERGKEQFPLSELKNVIQKLWGWTEDVLPPVKKQQLDEQITELAEKDGLLVKASEGRDPTYLFLHLTFQEYLTACHLADRVNVDGWEEAVVKTKSGGEVPVREFVDGHAWQSAWQEAIVLLTGRLDNPLPLVEMLADEAKDDPFHHRLALSAHCLTEIPELQNEV